MTKLQYVIKYKNHILTNPQELHKALSKIETLRSLFINLYLERWEVKK